MDVMGIASVATEMAQARTASSVQMAVLKIALNAQAQGASQLVQAAAQTIPNNPPHLGQRVDVFA